MYHQEMRVFGYMHKILYIFKKVISKLMSLKSANTIINNQTVENKKKSQSDSQLNELEIATLLSLIKQSSFNGSDIETIYNLVLKLQQQYVNIKK